MYRFFFIVLISFFLFTQLTYSQVPQLINYQGYINSNGNALNGTFTIEFSLLNQVSGGTYLWVESQEVVINEGNFNVLLGSINELKLSLFADNELFLEIKIGSEILSPRVQFTSLAYSMLAKSVEEESIDTKNILDEAITQAKLSNDIIFTPSGTAGGDLGGDYPNPTVQKIQGNPISSTEPVSGQVLEWDGSNWSPKNITTGSTDGIISVDGVRNDGGDVDLVAGSNVTILSDDASNTITISSSGGTGGGDITKVTAGNGLIGGGETADVTLNVGAGTGISVSTDAISLNTVYTDGRYINVGETNIISSIDGVTNDQGNIDLVAGNNISITPNNTTNTITIEATGSASGDNLGNHIATQNLRLNGYYLSGDGGNEGIYVNNNGNVGIGTNNISKKLEIGTPATSENHIRILSSTYGGLLFSNSYDNWQGGINFYHPKKSLLFDTDGPGSAKMIITDNGKVGIGTGNETDIDNLNYRLELGKTNESFNHIRIAASDWGGLLFNDGTATTKQYCGGMIYGFETNSLTLVTKNIDGDPHTRILIDGSGKVGIGTENLYYRLELGLPSETTNYMRISSNSWGGLAFHDGASGAEYSGEFAYNHLVDAIFMSTKSPNGIVEEKMRITSDGKVGIGTKTPSRTLTVNGDAGGNTSWYNDSDRRLKTNVNIIDNALDKVLALDGVYFNWKDSETYTDGRHLGFIAQDALDIIPEVVEKKGEFYSMQYAPITALLLEAMKEQQKIIDNLKKRLDDIEKSLKDR